LEKGASDQTSHTEPTEQPAIAGDLMKETEEECTQSFGLIFAYNIYIFLSTEVIISQPTDFHFSVSALITNMNHSELWTKPNYENLS
jgi:hypothetical protein